MSEPNSASDPTPEVPKAPSFTYGEAAPAPQQTPEPSSPLPPPMYGERMPDYAAAPAYGTPAYGTPVYGAAVPPVKRRRVWDLVLTVILLVLGLFGMGIGLIYAAIFADPVLVQDVFDQAYGQSGLGSWNGDVGAAPAIIAISHIVLYLIALGVSIPMLIKNKIAFWVPLTAGVIAAIVFWGTFMAIMFSDPSLLSGTIR
ncbi:MAG: DUF6264 family protein [Pseudolysinimonas sp.]|jgi:hypothetical protein|uniref:DUF6264 family protein n=1 Tax=Pseudolysinimonas sp. TaxID=2680009 RepID=UPI003C7324A1